MTPWILIGIPLGLFAYAYAGYPLILALAGGLRRRRVARPAGERWPTVSICLPAYNEAETIRDTLESLLAIDYPPDRRQILVVSDASTDGTDEIVESYAPRGVELLRIPERGGKTAAENAAAPLLTGEIVVNTDATIRILPDSLKPLVRALDDPSVGVASGRDVSVGDEGPGANRGESGYVSYEMRVRRLETRLGSIVGASGCFYAIRRELHLKPVPDPLSRDFASALVARENGYRAVSVDEAVCLVPRTASLRREFRRKVRTMARGLDTLFFKRHLLNPLRYGGFSFMLFSHKLCRWLVPPLVPLALLGLALLGLRSAPFAVLTLLVLGLAAAGGLALARAETRRLPRILALSAYVVAGVLAGMLAWSKSLGGERNPIWEPTRRGGTRGTAR
ncbi:MAG: glycosyltransferase family 2 protein [Gemmatimonadota bacterium]